jgi:hypothetical protein
MKPSEKGAKMLKNNLIETLHYPITHRLSSCLIPQDPCNAWILRLRFAARRMTEGVLQVFPYKVAHQHVPIQIRRLP